ncbi:uncharacterized protein B0I36DRAFT_340446 [Microdochium trichocladiopsis]|uniref:Uncharacterized protein n=1 Tax=Microdochium trichocladiopsis TaxID=1682393 RepID=A0A9P9BHM1_9PEZI|nr:uncharacterized protein B0I36DRAFT_340446 [Microdochium trichocladiopsis]KAH7012046.1 hypothetical protein B0I36DRAFT_340446 [Microdochium trichocladiopsis]
MATFLDRVTATGREHVRNHLHPFCSLCKEELDIYSKVVIFDLASDDEHPIGCKTHMIRSFRRSHEITPQEIPCEAQRSYCADINCHQCSPNYRSVSAHQQCVKWLQDISHAFEKQSVLDSDSYVIFFLRTQSPWTQCWSGPLLPPKLLYEPGHEAPSGEQPPQRQLRTCGPAEQDEHPPQPPYLPIEIMMQIFNLADETSRRWLYLRHSVLRPRPGMVEKRWDLRRVRSWKRGEDPKVVGSAVPSEDLWLKFDCSGLVELCTASGAGVHGWNDIYLFCKVDSTSLLQDSHAIFQSGMCYVKPPDDYGGQILLANSTIAYNKLLPPESESAIVANGKCIGITFFLLRVTDEIVGVHVHTKSISHPTRTHRWLEASKNCRLGSIFIPLAPLGASFMVVKWDKGGFSPLQESLS